MGKFVTLLLVLGGVSALGFSGDPTCIPENTPQKYIIPDNDQLFFKEGTLKRGELLKDWGSQLTQVRDDYYLLDLNGYRAGFNLLGDNVMQVSFEDEKDDNLATYKKDVTSFKKLQSAVFKIST